MSTWSFNHADGCWYIVGFNCIIALQPRPVYCNRGNWLATIEPTSPAIGVDRVLHLDGHDGWLGGRYYFNLQRAKDEVEAWMIKREQWIASPLQSASDEPVGPGRLRVNELFSFLCVNKDGDEAVPAFVAGGVMWPMVCADLKSCDSLRGVARELAADSGKSIVLARFSQRTDIDSISGPQAQFDAMVPPKGAEAVNLG